MSDLTSNQRKAILALTTLPTIKAAALYVGVTERTIYRWMQDPIFKAELKKAEAELMGEASRRLIALLQKALDRLEGLLSSKTIKPGDLNRSIALAFEYAMRAREVAEIEERLSDLERTIR